MERICDSNIMGRHFASLTEGFSNSLFREETLPCAPRSPSLRAILYAMLPAVSTGSPVCQRAPRKPVLFVRALGLLGAHLGEDYQCIATWLRVQVFRAPAALQVFTAPCWKLWGFRLIQTIMKSLCFLSAPLLRSKFPSSYWPIIDNYWKTWGWRGDMLFCLLCSSGNPPKRWMLTEGVLLMPTAVG